MTAKHESPSIDELRDESPSPDPNPAPHGRIHPKRATPRCRTARVQSHARRARPPIAAGVPPGAWIPRADFFPSVICLMQSPASWKGRRGFLSGLPNYTGKMQKMEPSMQARARGRQRHSARACARRPRGAAAAAAAMDVINGVREPWWTSPRSPSACAGSAPSPTARVRARGRAGARGRGGGGAVRRAAARAPRAARSAEWTRRVPTAPLPRAGTQE